MGQLLGWGGHRAKSTGLHKPGSIAEGGGGQNAKDRLSGGLGMMRPCGD
ncbi:hypothetical protein DLM_1455 [Aquitalea magnusonii]|uniref:Uncharacterized protein n=1 Tax=Aquitalea magnusonii TaxID=332411 RepID=A0A3G9GEJ7_9NEIS|nr:hypothetical protein DLM_1455 [Aquitalea magnusonii]